MATAFKWLGGILLVLVALVVIVFSLPNWNALRGPIERSVEDRTGRALSLGGDLKVRLGWPGLRVSVADVRFANPRWATRPQMVTVRRAGFDVEILPLLRRRLVFDDVRVDGADVSLEKRADGRRNWLLDRQQRDEQASVQIRRLAVSDGRIEYLEPAVKTEVRAAVSTGAARDALPLRFRVDGRYRGEPLQASGRGGSVLGLRDARAPYRFAVNGALGPTKVEASGQVTELMTLGAVDLQVDLRGQSLADLYPYTGVVLPDTPPYRTAGRLKREGSVWRYEKFSGRIGSSDIAGSLQVEVGGARPRLTADLRSRRLDLADLGPVIGASDKASAKQAGRVLPSEPFRTDRWKRMDADVRLAAGAIRRPDALPLDNLTTRLQLRGGVLTLSPLKFDAAGGTLAGTVKLDGSQPRIRADVDLEARGLRLARLVPKAAEIEQASLGQINGDVDLKGTGNSVAAMLGSADGRAALVIDGGTVSRLMMEAVSLHLLEMLHLKLTGDEVIRIRCGVAEFGVKDGVMQADTVVFDTDVVRVDASGTVDLAQEQLDLRVVPRTRKLSLIALRTPINIEGKFAAPDVGLAKGPLAARGLGALALGALNPALAVVALIDANTAPDSQCRKWIADARRPG